MSTSAGTSLSPLAFLSLISLTIFTIPCAMCKELSGLYLLRLRVRYPDVRVG